MAELELEIMKNSVTEAKRYRSAIVSGACRLPTEVLGTIFSLAQKAYWDPDRHRPGTDGRYRDQET